MLGQDPGMMKFLVESVEGKFTRARSEEWQLAGNFAPEETVPALLLVFLAHDGRHTHREWDVASFRKDFNHILESTQDKRSKSGSELDGRVEVRDREYILAWLDWSGVEVRQCVVSIQSMEFLLSQDRSSRFDDKIAIIPVDFVALDLLSDILQEIGKKRDFEEKLICSNKAQTDEAVRADIGRRRPVRQGSKCILLYLFQLSRVRIWKSVS